MGIGDWGLGIGDWGFGVWGWVLGYCPPPPFPTPQSPNPQSPFNFNMIESKYFNLKLYSKFFLKLKNKYEF